MTGVLMIQKTVLFLLLITSTVVLAERLPDFNIDKNTTSLNMSVYKSFDIMLHEDPDSGYLWNVTNSSGIRIISDKQWEDELNIFRSDRNRYHIWFVKPNITGNLTFSAVLMREDKIFPGNEGTYNLTLNVW